MVTINKTIVPYSKAEDYAQEDSVWKDGKYVMSKGTRTDTYYIGHEYEEHQEELPTGEVITKNVCRAFAINVRKGALRGDVINAAEMTAYGLRDAMDVASFNAALARKFREDPDDAECKEHDAFISWVKKELNKI